MKAVNDIDIGAAYRIERPNLELSILKVALFMRVERMPQPLGDRVAEFVGSLERE